MRRVNTFNTGDFIRIGIEALSFSVIAVLSRALVRRSPSCRTSGAGDIGQREYFDRYGVFPDNQRASVESYLRAEAQAAE